MTRNKLFVAIVAAALMSVALPAGAYHIDHHNVGTGTPVTWRAGTGVLDACEVDNDPTLQMPRGGEGGLCFAHNHTMTNDTDLVGPANNTTMGDAFETTFLGHHKGNGSGPAGDHNTGQNSIHNWTSSWGNMTGHNESNWKGHADHGVFEGIDGDTALDQGFDIGIAAAECDRDAGGNTTNGPDDYEWTALNLTESHQDTDWIEIPYTAQISGVQAADVDGAAGERFVYHEQTACLADDGHVSVFVNGTDAAVAEELMGSYTTWGQGEMSPCPSDGDRVCATTNGASPI